MKKLYGETIKKGRKVFHGSYTLYHYHKAVGLYVTAFEGGEVRMILLEAPVGAAETTVTVCFEDGQTAKWQTTWVSSYLFQFGVAASCDGSRVFFQTWENGLLCLDARTGEKLWRTKSKRGITNIFVNRNTLLIHQHDRALQLVDICSGEVLKEKRPATAWGFTAIDHQCIVCQVTQRRWEIIEAETLESPKAFSHREFTGGHEDYRVNRIALDGRELVVGGFRNVWSESGRLLPNREFEHRIPVAL